MKTDYPRAWWFVAPVVLLVAFNALVPLMTVVNYSVQETFGNNLFFWHGLGWFQDVLQSERFHAALGRQIMFTAIILVIQIPLGVAIALCMPKRGAWVSVCLVLMAMPLLVPWNVVGAMWNIISLPDIGLLGYGPGNSTTLLSIDLVKVALGQFDLGPAAAMSLIYFLITLLVSWIFYTLMTRNDP